MKKFGNAPGKVDLVLDTTEVLDTISKDLDTSLSLDTSKTLDITAIQGSSSGLASSSPIWLAFDINFSVYKDSVENGNLVNDGKGNVGKWVDLIVVNIPTGFGVFNAGAKGNRKRTLSMDVDLLDLENLNLNQDLYSRRRILQLRFFKRTKFDQEVVLKEDGSVVLGKFF